ncbi:MAG: hypothetical protein ACI4JJ_04075 [Huintestinicola sp.]
MTNDCYVEQLIEKRPGGAEAAKKIGIGLAAVIVGGALAFFFFPMGIILAGFAFYGAFYLISGCDVEYEYIFTNGDLDIDKIIGKRKRKRLITAKLSEFTAFGPIEEAAEAGHDVTTVLAADGTGQNEYYADFKHASAGNVRIIFTPEEKLLDGIVMFLPRKLKTGYLAKHRK